MKYIYTEEQINAILNIINNFEFTSGKNMKNAELVVSITNIIQQAEMEKEE